MMRWAAFALAFVAASGSSVAMLKEVKKESRGSPGEPEGVFGAGANTQVVNLGLGTSQLHNGNRVWTDLGDSEWRNVPVWLQGITALLPSSQVGSDKAVFWECSDSTNTGGVPFCEIHVWVYPCEACPDYHHGGIRQRLLDLGWELYKCAPSVVAVAGGATHGMIGYTRRLAAGSDYTLIFEAPLTEFTVYGIDNAPDACSAHPSESACLSPDRNGKCDWDGSTCSLKKCNANSIGPSASIPCTDRCITAELPAPA